MTWICKKSYFIFLNFVLSFFILCSPCFSNIYNEIDSNLAQMAVAKDGKSFYILNKNRQILHYDLEETLLHRWMPKDPNGKDITPDDIRCGYDGSLIVVENKNFLQFSPEGNLLKSMVLDPKDESFRMILYFDVSVEGWIVASSGSVVYWFDSEGRILRKFDFSSSRRNVPHGVAFSGYGTVYVADASDESVKCFDIKGEIVRRWGAKGKEKGQFSFPRNIAVGPDQSVYVTDVNNYRVQKFTSKGEYLLSWGQKGIKDGYFSQVNDISVSDDGRIFVLDVGNCNIQVFDKKGGLIKRLGRIDRKDWELTGDWFGKYDSTGYEILLRLHANGESVQYIRWRNLMISISGYWKADRKYDEEKKINWGEVAFYRAGEPDFWDTLLYRVGANKMLILEAIQFSPRMTFRSVKEESFPSWTKEARSYDLIFDQGELRNPSIKESFEIMWVAKLLIEGITKKDYSSIDAVTDYDLMGEKSWLQIQLKNTVLYIDSLPKKEKVRENFHNILSYSLSQSARGGKVNGSPQIKGAFALVPILMEMYFDDELYWLLLKKTENGWRIITFDKEKEAILAYIGMASKSQ